MSARLIVHEQGGRVTVSLQPGGQLVAMPAGEPFEFDDPLTEGQREDLRWYLEDYLQAPYAVYEERGERVQSQLLGWGEALFGVLFGPGRRARDAYLRARDSDGATELVLSSQSAGFFALPWELLKDPERAEPLALSLTTLDRTFGTAAPAVKDAPSGDVLRVLMVIARPQGVRDVGYQMIARRLLERLDAVRGRVELDVLRPPTLEALRTRLQEAETDKRPYQIVHFDGHGTFASTARVSGMRQYDLGAPQGYLVFEQDNGGQHLVEAGQFALTVNRYQLPLVVLNACRSGTLGEAAVEAAVATRLLEGGTASVVAMGYSVYAVAAAEFMTAFYEALFAGESVSTAVTAGRRRLYSHKGRPSPKGSLPLDDWMVPVHYLRRPVNFPELKRERPAGKPSLDQILGQLGQRPAQVAGVPVEGLLEAVGRFVGRDAEFYELELALRLQRVVLVYGPGGMGKTELAKGFARWWRDSGGLNRPDLVLFHSFEPGVASFGLDGVATAIGLKLFGPEFIGKTSGSEQRQSVVVEALRQYRMLLVWDNFESVYTMPDPNGATPALDERQRHEIAGFLAELAEHGQSGVIITSRTPETWLGNIRRIELGGLRPVGAAELADDVLAPYPRARARRQERAYADLLVWFGGHPLSMRLMLPHLEHLSSVELLTALRGESQKLPPGFEGNAAEGRLESLGASIKHSFEQLDRKIHERLGALALFEEAVNEDVLAIFSEVKEVPALLAGHSKEAWHQTLETLTGVGLLTPLGGGMYALHPALPAYLVAHWRLRAGAGYETERAVAQQALLQAYAAFGNWLNQEIQSGSAETVYALLERQRRTMGRLVGQALEQGRYAEAQALLQPLNDYWNVRGLAQEAGGWVDRCRKATEGIDGAPPDFAGAAGELWLFMVVGDANRSLSGGALDAAEAAYQLIRHNLEQSTPGSPNRLLAVDYHQLGMVAQLRGELEQAEQWYRKSLEIKEELKDRPGLARSYHQLGMVVQLRGELEQAEQWYRKSLEIEEALGNRPGLASSYHQLGIVAQLRGELEQAEQWYRKSLEIREALKDRPGLASSYHHLGIVAQLRGELEQAEQWYRKSLEIREALKDRPGLAGSYGQLGLLAEKKNDENLALDWTVRCVALFHQFPHPATGPGPQHLARLTAKLGMPALQSSWQRQTGKMLPPQVRSVIEQMIEEPQKKQNR